jgi:hypothetical protein
METLYFDSKTNIWGMITALQGAYSKYKWRVRDSADIQGALKSGFTVFYITIRPCEWSGYRMRVCASMASESAFQIFLKETKEIIAMLEKL